METVEDDGGVVNESDVGSDAADRMAAAMGAAAVTMVGRDGLMMSLMEVRVDGYGM